MPPFRANRNGVGRSVYDFVTVALALEYAVPAKVTAVNVSGGQLAFCVLKVNVTVESAAPELAIVSVNEVPAEGAVKAPPDPAPLEGVDTVTVCPVPRPVTVLPEASVTLTFAVNVPLLPSAVSVHVLEHGDDRVPAETVT